MLSVLGHILNGFQCQLDEPVLVIESTPRPGRLPVDFVKRTLDSVIVQEVLHADDHQRVDCQRVTTHEDLLTFGARSNG